MPFELVAKVAFIRVVELACDVLNRESGGAKHLSCVVKSNLDQILLRGFAEGVHEVPSQLAVRYSAEVCQISCVKARSDGALLPILNDVETTHNRHLNSLSHRREGLPKRAMKKRSNCRTETPLRAAIEDGRKSAFRAKDAQS